MITQDAKLALKAAKAAKAAAKAEAAKVAAAQPKDNSKKNKAKADAEIKKVANSMTIPSQSSRDPLRRLLTILMQ